MKTNFKILAALNLAFYSYLLIFPVSILANMNWEIANSSNDASLFISDQPANCLINFNFRSIKEIRFEKSTKFKGIDFKTIITSKSLPKIKAFLQKEDLYFNLPLICYKFPLSEHTEEG